MLSKLFSPAAMELNLKAQDQERAFRELVALVPHLDDGGRAGLLLSLLGRERLGSTALGRSVALPHTRYVVRRHKVPDHFWPSPGWDRLRRAGWLARASILSARLA